MREGQPERLLLLVGAVALGLVGVSWLLALVPLGGWGTPIALAIAGAKGFLVVWYFMELREAVPTIRIAALVTGILFVLLVGLAAADVASRDLPEAPIPYRPR